MLIKLKKRTAFVSFKISNNGESFKKTNVPVTYINHIYWLDGEAPRLGLESSPMETF